MFPSGVLLRPALLVAAVGCGSGCGCWPRGSQEGSTEPEPAPDPGSAPDPDSATGSDSDSDSTPARPPCPAFAAGAVAGRVDSAAVDEASGLAAGRRNPGVLWVHNDSGDSPRLFALGRDGSLLAVARVEGAEAQDWEDLAAGPGPDPGVHYLYVGDIGDNRARRASVQIYRLPEPEVPAGGGELSVRATRFDVVYPDGPRDAETLLVDPTTGDVVIITKALSGPSTVLRVALPASPGGEVTAAAVASVDVGMATAGDVSPDGLEVVIRTYSRASLFRRPPGSPLWRAFAAPPCPVPLRAEPQGETLAFEADGGAYLTVSEGSLPEVFRYARAPGP